MENNTIRVSAIFFQTPLLEINANNKETIYEIRTIGNRLLAIKLE